MSLGDFEIVFKCLDPTNAAILKELLQLYDAVTSNIEQPYIIQLSEECLEFLRNNLINRPYPAATLIQSLLCVWNPNLSRTDNVLEDLYLEVLVALVAESQPTNRTAVQKLLSIIAQLKLSVPKMITFLNVIVPQIYRATQDGRIDNQFVYLSLIPQNSLPVLKSLFDLETTDPNKIQTNWSDPTRMYLRFANTMTHWLLEMVDDQTQNDTIPIQFQKNMNILKMFIAYSRNDMSIATVNTIQQCLYNITPNQTDEFIRYCKLELQRQVNLIIHCFQNNALKICDVTTITNVARNNSCLSTLVRFLDISKFESWKPIQELLKRNEALLYEMSANMDGQPKSVSWDLTLFHGYCIMINLLKCVVSTTFNTAEEYFERITITLNEAKQSILHLEDRDFQLDIIENIFALLFIRYEHFSEIDDENATAKLSGFVCNDLVLRDILAMLRYCLNDINLGISRDETKEVFWNRLQNISKYITDAHWRLYLLTPTAYLEDVHGYGDKPFINFCRCEESSGNLVQCLYTTELDSSDSETDVKTKSIQSSIESRTSDDGENWRMPIASAQPSETISTMDEKTKPVRRKKQRRSETDKSSEGSETTVSSGRAHRKFLKRSNNNDAIRERRYLINFMLASPYSLICLCLGQRDYLKVQEIIKMYNLESSHIAWNVTFTKNLQALRRDLRSLIENYQTQEPQTGETSKFQKFKIEMGAAYNSAQLIGPTEKFISTNRLPEHKDTKAIIDQFVSIYPFLNNYDFKNELFMHVFDLAITLGHTYDQSVTLLKCACRHPHRLEKNSDYMLFYENVTRCHQKANSSKGNFSIADVLNDYKYPLNLKVITKKLSFVTSLCESTSKFTESLNSKLVPDLSHKYFSQVIQAFTEFNKGGESGARPNLLQRLDMYLSFLFQLFKMKESTTPSIRSQFAILELSRSEIVGKVVFEQQTPAKELESVFAATFLDLVYDLAMSSCPKIEIKNKTILNEPFEISDTMNVHDIIDEALKPNIPKCFNYTLYTPTPNVLTYIEEHNSLLALLIARINAQSEYNNLDSKRIMCLDKIINSDKTFNLAFMFHDNLVMTALQSCIPRKHLYKHLLDITECTDMTNFEQMARIVKLINSLPEKQIKNDFYLVRIRDAVLFSLGENTEVPTFYKQVEFIQNIQLRVTSVLNNLKAWPGDVCIRVLKSLLTDFRLRMDDRWYPILKGELLKIQVYQEVCEKAKYNSWYEVYLQKDSMNSMSYKHDDVFRKLVEMKLISTSLRWYEILQMKADISNQINVAYIRQIFETNEPNFDLITNLLNDLPKNTSIDVCYELLTCFKNVQYLTFLVDYINVRNGQITPKCRNFQVGIKIASFLLTTEDCSNVWSIISQPILIIEQLIMNTRLDKLSQILRAINPMINDTIDESIISTKQIDQLLRMYAKKSLEFRIGLPPSSTGSERSTESTSTTKQSVSKLMQSLDSVSDIDFEQDSFVMPENAPTKSQWMQDHETGHCLCCQETTFSMFNRRHHCRRCGRVVCGSCSTNRLQIPMYGAIAVRVCRQCYDLTSQQANSKMNAANSYRTDSVICGESWQLTDDQLQNNLIREQFSYEYAPSVSHCLAILKLHSINIEYPIFLIDQCYDMLQLILPTQGSGVNNEIDYTMAIQMLRSLLIAAKVGSARNSCENKLLECDQLLVQIDVIAMLAKSDCLHLLPREIKGAKQSSTNRTVIFKKLRQLRDNLMENEKWVLALEVSTKAGLDTTGVLAAWGKTCLKAGSLQQARQKFQNCLDKLPSTYDLTSSDNSMNIQKRLRHSESRLSNINSGLAKHSAKTPALVNEIIEILESSAAPLDPGVLKHAESAKDHELKLQKATNSSTVSLARGDPALLILSKLANLKNVSQGNFNIVYPQCPRDNTKGAIGRRNSKSQPTKIRFEDQKPYIDPRIYDECIYYLETYGSYSSLIDFFLRHGNIKQALIYISKNKLDTELYVQVYTHCLKNGCIDQLHLMMSQIDGTLGMWKDGLRHVCRYLEQNDLLHTLYQLQIWTEDNVRAAMTCIKFFQSGSHTYTELSANLDHLRTAQRHLKLELETEHQWVQVEPKNLSPSTDTQLVLKMESREIDKHITTIWRQMEITKFLTSCEKAKRPTIEALLDIFVVESPTSVSVPNVIPTLFGSKIEKIQLAILAIISGGNVTEGFGLAFRIIHDYQLNASKVYCIVAKYLVGNGRESEIHKLLECINTSGIPEDSSIAVCDEILLMAVRTMATTMTWSVAQFESFIKLIHDTSVKITAYIECRQLKSAYLTAVRYDCIRDVRRILREAERLNQPHIRAICAKRLAQVKDNSDK